MAITTTQRKALQATRDILSAPLAAKEAEAPRLLTSWIKILHEIGLDALAIELENLKGHLATGEAGRIGASLYQLSRLTMEAARLADGTSQELVALGQELEKAAGSMGFVAAGGPFRGMVRLKGASKGESASARSANKVGPAADRTTPATSAPAIATAGPRAPASVLADPSADKTTPAHATQGAPASSRATQASTPKAKAPASGQTPETITKATLAKPVAKEAKTSLATGATKAVTIPASKPTQKEARASKSPAGKAS